MTVVPTLANTRTLFLLRASCPAGLEPLRRRRVNGCSLAFTYCTCSCATEGEMFNTPPSKVVPVSSLPNRLRHWFPIQQYSRCSSFSLKTEVVFLYANVWRRSLAILSKVASCTKENFHTKFLTYLDHHPLHCRKQKGSYYQGSCTHCFTVLGSLASQLGFWLFLCLHW